MEPKEGSIPSPSAGCGAREVTACRINSSSGVWLHSSILLNQEEFILFLLLCLCMDFWLHKESWAWEADGFQMYL